MRCNAMKLIVGLGNPGIRYAMTRHNVGFWVIDRLSEEWGIPVHQEKWKASMGSGRVGEERVILLKPLTYMNLSGESVRPALEWLKGGPDDLVVIYDDLDLAPGQIRLRTKGSSGGHRGMQSIIDHLGTNKFKRVKIGIGRPEGPIPVPNYVLSSFSPQEEEPIAEAVDRSVAAIQTYLETTFEQAMNRFNRR